MIMRPESLVSGGLFSVSRMQELLESASKPKFGTMQCTYRYGVTEASRIARRHVGAYRVGG